MHLKSTLGIGFVMTQYYFSNTGIYIGIFNTIFLTVIIGYCMVLLVTVASDIEEK